MSMELRRTQPWQFRARSCAPQGNYQVYEIVTHDDATSRGVILLKKERKEGFRRIQIKPCEPIRFAVDGNAAYVVDSRGVERVVIRGPWEEERWVVTR